MKDGKNYEPGTNIAKTLTQADRHLKSFAALTVYGIFSRQLVSLQM
jgi:hypothetical protein